MIGTTRLLFLVGGLGTVVFMFELVRRREVREKYAVLWVILGVGIALVGAFPSLLDRLAHALGVESPPNLLFFVALLILLLVCVHLSWEVSRLEKETRALTEELAVHRLEAELDTGISAPHPTEPRTPGGGPGAPD